MWSWNDVVFLFWSGGDGNGLVDDLDKEQSDIQSTQQVICVLSDVKYECLFKKNKYLLFSRQICPVAYVNIVLKEIYVYVILEKYFRFQTIIVCF